MMKRIFSEPLFHFLLAGLCLFLAYSWLNREAGPDERSRIVRISQADVTWLRETWVRQNQREPDDQELRTLITEYLKESLMAREATELGLEDNDIIVRRRLAQKMEFLIRDTANLAEPSEEALHQLYESTRTRGAGARISLTQIFFKSEDAAIQGLKRVARDSANLGDRTVLESEYEGIDSQGVASVFGKEFSERVFPLPTGEWQGPIASAYGFHLVLIRERQDPEVRTFEEVRPQLVEEWQRIRQEEARKQFYAELFQKYEVVADDSVRSLIGPLAQTN